MKKKIILRALLVIALICLANLVCWHVNQRPLRPMTNAVNLFVGMGLVLNSSMKSRE